MRDAVAIGEGDGNRLAVLDVDGHALDREAAGHFALVDHGVAVCIQGERGLAVASDRVDVDSGSGVQPDTDGRGRRRG
ncbi:hypothetical protein FQZ97_1036460 [compost metagenome]